MGETIVSAASLSLASSQLSPEMGQPPRLTASARRRRLTSPMESHYRQQATSPLSAKKMGMSSDR
jgi:hypothetical protein